MTLTTPACVWEWFCYRVTGYLNPCVRIRLKLLAGESCLERIRGIEEDLGIYMYVSSVRYQTLFTAWKKGGGVIRGFWGRVTIRFTWIPPSQGFLKFLCSPPRPPPPAVVNWRSILHCLPLYKWLSTTNTRFVPLKTMPCDPPSFRFHLPVTVL